MQDIHLDRSLSIVLPIRNEEAVVADTVHGIVDTLKSWKVQDFEVIVVDDGSQDRTGVILDIIATANERVHVIHHEVSRGYGAILVSGFKAVTKDLAFFMNADGQFDIHDLKSFFPLMLEYDAVLGYRVKRQDAWIKKLGAWVWKILVGMVFRIYVRDINCAFKLYRADFFRNHILETRGAMVNAEILYKFVRAGHTFTQAEVHQLPRRGGSATGVKPGEILPTLFEMVRYAWKWHREEEKEKEEELRKASTKPKSMKSK